jgi:hypothetical protein
MKPARLLTYVFWCTLVFSQSDSADDGMLSAGALAHAISDAHNHHYNAPVVKLERLAAHGRLQRIVGVRRVAEHSSALSARLYRAPGGACLAESTAGADALDSACAHLLHRSAVLRAVGLLVCRVFRTDGTDPTRGVLTFRLSVTMCRMKAQGCALLRNASFFSQDHGAQISAVRARCLFACEGAHVVLFSPPSLRIRRMPWIPQLFSWAGTRSTRVFDQGRSINRSLLSFFPLS